MSILDQSRRAFYKIDDEIFGLETCYGRVTGVAGLLSSADGPVSAHRFKRNRRLCKKFDRKKKEQLSVELKE